MNEINIAVDVFSYSKDIWSVSDYSGEQIYSKLALPLFRYENESPQLFAAASFKQTLSNITLNLREDLFWSNGDPVTADDYSRAIQYIIGAQENRYHKLLLSVIRHPRGIEVPDKYILSINTAWYDPFIIHYLSLINFSPMHSSDLNLYAGPYVIKETSEKSCQLVPNPFFQCEESEDWIEKINYKLLPSDPEACSFKNGDIHVSCDTSLDLHHYRQILKDTDFHQGNDTLVMLLSPGDKFSELPFDVLQLTGCAVDREKIASLYDNMLIPLESWLALYKENFYKCDFSSASLRTSPVELDVAFEDFYPNKEILQHFSEQLSHYNIILNFHEDNYGCWITPCHFRFEIRKMPKSNPIQLVRSDISRMSKNTKYYNEIKSEYSKLYNVANKSCLFDTFRKIDFYLRQQLLYLPLFVFPTGYFCHPKINTTSLMMPGSRIRIRK